jgi:hypothetical protein
MWIAWVVIPKVVAWCLSVVYREVLNPANLDTRMMAGVAPGRETESGGFGDVDKAGRGGFRVESGTFWTATLRRGSEAALALWIAT